MVKRRERAHQLIELGALLAKAGVVELTVDDRTVLSGVIDAAAALKSQQRDQARTLWRRRGRRAFEQLQNE